MIKKSFGLFDEYIDSLPRRYRKIFQGDESNYETEELTKLKKMKKAFKNSASYRIMEDEKDALYVELTARQNRGDYNPDLYHLSVFPNPTQLDDSTLHYNVHITQEPSGTGQRVYYRFNDVFGAVLRHDNAPPRLNVAAPEWRPAGLNVAAPEFVPGRPAAPSGKYVPPHMRRGGKTKKRTLKKRATRRRRLQKKRV